MAKKPRSTRFWRCMSEVRKIAGENLTEDELVELAERLMTKARKLRETRYGMTADEAVNSALMGMSEDIIRASKLKKRHRYLSHLAFSREFGTIEQNWADDPRKGLEVALIGSNIARRGAQRSLDADQKGMSSEYVNGFAADVERLGPDKYKLYATGDLDQDVYRALDQMYKSEPDYTSIDRDAREFAQIIYKYQQVVRVDKNYAGAWIDEKPDYITHQAHDQFAVRRAAAKLGGKDMKSRLTGARADEAENFRAWKDFVLPRLDEEQTFGDMSAAEREPWLKRVWLNIASGEHLKSASASNGFPTRSSLASKMSQPRILHFKDAQSRFEYDTNFGIGGSLFERVLHQLYQSGHDVALMRRFGPNPEETYNRLKKAVRIATEMSVHARDSTVWARDERILDSYWAEITGDARTPGTDPFSTALRASRLIATVSKLGGAVISSLTDTGIASSELQYHGISLTSSWKTQLDGLMQGYGQRGQQRADRLQLASEMGVAVDYLRSAVWSRFSADDALPGWASRLQHWFFKISFLTWHTDTLRMANAQRLSHNLAINASKAMPELDAKLQRVLMLFDIKPAEWDLMRNRAVDTVEGKEYLSPKGASRITDIEIAAILKAEGIKPTVRRVIERRDDIQTKFRDFISARADYAVITPGPRTRTYMTGQRFGIQPGGQASELARSLMQFKSFPASVIEKVWGRELYGYSPDGKLTSASSTGMGQLAQFIVYSMFLGFTSMYLKAFFAGRDIKAPETAKDARNLMLAAFLQGGGAGIYGDFLLGQGKDRFGRSALSSALGPGVGDLEDLYSMMKGAIGIPGAEDSGKAAGTWAAHSFQTALHHTPLINLFYTRMALDYMVLFRLQEQISPGYLKRLEKRWKEEHGQEYRLPPSQNYEAENLGASDIGALLTPAPGFSTGQ
jgi:hypothetical protein